MSSTREQRIATALAAKDVTSDDIGRLVSELETAIVAADKAADAENERALDRIASPDATKAREAMESAEFARDRLRTVLPRLQQRLREVEEHEYRERWRARYEALKPERDALAAQFRAYPEI